MYFDSHAHYNDERFDEDRDALLKDIHEKGVGYIINAGQICLLLEKALH